MITHRLNAEIERYKTRHGNNLEPAVIVLTREQWLAFTVGVELKHLEQPMITYHDVRVICEDDIIRLN